MLLKKIIIPILWEINHKIANGLICISLIISEGSCGFTVLSSHCHSAKVSSGGDNRTKIGMALLTTEKTKMHEQVIAREDLKCANHLKSNYASTSFGNFSLYDVPTCFSPPYDLVSKYSSSLCKMVENELFPRVPNKNPVGSFGILFPLE